MMRTLFTVFWGMLAWHAAHGVVESAHQGRWHALVLGLVVLGWAGANTILWGQGKRGLFRS